MWQATVRIVDLPDLYPTYVIICLYFVLALFFLYKLGKERFWAFVWLTLFFAADLIAKLIQISRNFEVVFTRKFALINLLLLLFILVIIYLASKKVKIKKK